MTEREKDRDGVPAGLFRASRQPPPPPKPREGDADKRFKSTLVGVPISQPPPPLDPVLAPPRWTGARAYEEGNTPEPKPSTISRPPPAPSAETEPGPTNLRDSLERILDERLPSGEGAPPHVVAESGLRSGEHEHAVAPVAPVEDIGEEDLEVDTELEEELDAYAEAVADPKPLPVRSSLLPVPVPQASRLSDRELFVRDEPLVQLSPSMRAEAERQGWRSPPASVPRLVPELDPTLASRVAPSSVAPQLVPNEPSAAGSGFVFVGLMTLIAVGGWYITQGGFVSSRRAPPSDVAAPPALPRVPAAEAVAPVAAPAPTPHAAAAPEVDPVPPSAPVAPAPSVTPASALPAETGEPARRSARRPVAGHAFEPPAEPAASVEPVAEPATPVLQVAPAVEPALPAPPAVALPEKPSREEVQRALEAVRPAVEECAHGMRGVAQADITVTDNGQVTQALVGGDFAGTPEGSCMARAVRKARFAPFREPRFRVIYPFRL